LKMFFKQNSIKFRYRLFNTCTNLLQEGLRLYWRQDVIQHHVNKEMYEVSVVFPLFCTIRVHLLVNKPNINLY
jgi:hypothetical protein